MEKEIKQKTREALENEKKKIDKILDNLDFS